MPCQAEPVEGRAAASVDMTSTAVLLTQAVAAHRAGRIDEAVSRYRVILANEPGHLRARHLLGFGLLQGGAAAEAEPLLAETTRRSPASADAWAHLGLARRELGRGQAALTALRHALVLAPAQLDAADGLTLLNLEQDTPAPIRLAARLVALAPSRAPGWHALGLAHAAAAPEGAMPLAAAQCLRRAVVISPGDPSAVVDLAESIRARRSPVDALHVIRQALRLRPDSAPARATSAAALFDLDRVEEADRMARSAAVLTPGAAEAYGNWAQCLYRNGKFEDAASAGRRASLAAPGNPQILANLASYRLACGDLDTGWALFGHRPARRAIAQAMAPHGLAEWTGQADARLLVLAEQGLGDELMFASCWQDLAAALRTGRLEAVRVEIDPRLRPLATRSYPELEWLDRDRAAALADGVRRSADFAATHWSAAGDLPAVFRRTLTDFPAAAGYLVPDPARVAGYRAWLDAAAPGRRLGFCWRSGLLTGDRTKHYPSIGDCGPVLRACGIKLIALQYDDISAELAEVARAGDPPILAPPNLDRRDDLDGVAALIAALDGVLTADTAVLALAGSLGAPTIGFGLGSNWMMLGRERSPWYPSVARVFRLGDEGWEEMMRRIAEQEIDRHLGRAGESAATPGK